MTGTLLNDFNRKQDFIGMNESDAAALRSMAELIRAELPTALDSLYRKIRETPQTQGFFTDNAHMMRAKQAQLDHWQRIAEARFDEDYVAHVQRIGAAHARIGLNPSLYIGAYGQVLVPLIRAVIDESVSKGLASRFFQSNAKPVSARIESLIKAVLLEIDLTISSYMAGVDEVRARLQEEQERRAQEDRSTVTALGEALSALANGDLSRRITDGVIPDRLDALRRHFNKAATTLEQTIRDISAEAAHVGTNASEIGHGADQLSSRTEQQAAAGEEMSAALGQIAERVKQTAMETRKTEQMVIVARREAEHADAIKNDTIAAMTAIETSSEEIGGIITIINEIAFQTNLLALNASVEAARAGDVGRGFAVVANEVRALSQRSREAAEAIGKLIAQSAGNVRLGVTKVREAGLALQKVMEQIRAISNAVTVIATSAQGQSQSLTELDVAMSGLEETTMKNAAAAEESADAVRSLIDTASSLSQLVRGFIIAGEIDGSAGRENSRALPTLELPPEPEGRRRDILETSS